MPVEVLLLEIVEQYRHLYVFTPVELGNFHRPGFECCTMRLFPLRLLQPPHTETLKIVRLVFVQEYRRQHRIELDLLNIY